MNETKEDMRGDIQQWFAGCITVQDVAETYAAIISETNRQLEYMSGQFARMEDNE